MKKLILTTLMLSAFSLVTNAAQIPNCWSTEGAAEVVDGQYKVVVSTKNLSAKDYAKILFELQGGPVAVLADGTTVELSEIEIDLQAPVLSDWRPSSAYPTFKDLAKETTDFLKTISALKGVRSISCIQDYKLNPHPGVSVSN